MKNIIDKIIWNITPRIDNLPQCIFIRWLGCEWFFPKT